MPPLLQLLANVITAVELLEVASTTAATLTISYVTSAAKVACNNVVALRLRT